MIGWRTFAAMPPSVSVTGLSTAGVDRTQQVLAEVLGLGEQNVDQLFCLLLQAVELRLDLLLALLPELRLLFLELILRLGDFSEQILLGLRRQDGALGRVLFFRYPFRFDPRQLDGI